MEERSLEELLAELLTGDEVLHANASSANEEPLDELVSAAPTTESTGHAVSNTAAPLPGSGADVPLPHVAEAQPEQQQNSSDNVDVDLLLQDLLTTPEAMHQADMSRTADLTRSGEAPPPADAHTSAADAEASLSADGVVAQEQAQRQQTAAGPTDILQDRADVGGSAAEHDTDTTDKEVDQAVVPAAAAATVSVNGVLHGQPAVVPAADGLLSFTSGNVYATAATGDTTAGTVPAGVPAAAQQLPSAVMSAATAVAGDAPDSSTSITSTQELPQAATADHAAITNDTSTTAAATAAACDSDDDDVLDMLHDMAEVLEVEPASAALEQRTETAMANSVTSALTSPIPSTQVAAAAANADSTTAGTRVGVVSVQQQQDIVSEQGVHLQAQRQADHEGVAAAGSMLSNGAAAPLQPAAPAATAMLPPHELALQQAWEYEETLYHGGFTVQHGQPTGQLQQSQQPQQRHAFVPLDPQARLTELLSDAKADWNPAGRPAASGTAMIGGAVLVKLESLAGLFAGAAGAAATSSGGGGASSVSGGRSSSSGGVDWAEVLAAALAPHGQMQVVASSGPYLALGSVTGSAIVLQLPQQGLAAQQQQASHNPTSATPGHQHSTLPGGAAMWLLGEGSTGDSVTSLGFSVITSGSDALWLAVGHASGALTVWELQKRGPRQVAGIAQHGARVTVASFFPGRSTSLLLTGDIRGRLCLHSFSSLLLRTSVNSKVLANGQYGTLLAINHLAPFTMPAPTLAQAAAVSAPAAGGAGGMDSQSVPGSPRLAFAGIDEASWKASYEDGTWRVGNGVFCLTTPTHVYIARIKPLNQDLVMLFSIPQPSPGPQAAVPTAAWLPHVRKASAGIRVWTAGTDGSAVGSNTVTVVPVAVLALGWGSRLVMFDVPLIGDHVTVGETGVSDAAPASAGALAAAAAAAGQLRRAGPASFTASKAAQRAQHTLEALNPNTAAQLAGHFPLSISGTWSGGAQGPKCQQASDNHNSQNNQSPQVSNRPEEQLLDPTEPLPILGVHWLDADAVAVVCQQGFSSLLVVLGFSSQEHHPSQTQHGALRVQEQVEWMEQPVDRQWSSTGGLAAWGVDCHNSIVGAGPRMYLLGQQGGVFCGRLMPWSERLKTLQDVRKFELGLYYALRFWNSLKQKQRRSSHTGGSDTHGSMSASVTAAGAAKPRTSVGGIARSEGFGAEPRQLEDWMLSLMLGHANAALHDAAATAGTQQQVAAASGNAVAPAVAAAAEISMCTCLLLSRPDVLFGRAYPLFARADAGTAGSNGAGGVTARHTVGGTAAFMQVLEVAVLSDLLQGLDPEVMQALVQYFVSIGQPERVEGCVLHLSITSLDLDQVIRLCEGSGLYSALTYIHNAIADYRKPLMDLLAAVAGACGIAAARRYGYKLLVYLRCCFRGLAFPPGTGKLPNSPPGRLDSIKATLLGSLLFVDSADLLAEWKHSGGRAAATAAALTAPSKADGFSCCGLSDPHPALQLLLSVDVAAVVSVLSEATSGWDAVETDLRAAAGKPASELESVLVATQVVVNAIVTLLEAGKFDQWQSSGSSGTDGKLSGSCVAMNYVIDLLAAGRVTVKPLFVLRLLEHLVSQAQSEATAVAVAEQQFMSICNVVGINATPAAAPMPGQQQQQQYDPAALSPAQAQAALQLASQAGFTRATATIHHLSGNYAQALAAYMQLARQQQQQVSAPESNAAAAAVSSSEGVFQYIERFLSSSSSTTARRHFMSCVVNQAEALIQLDAAATAALLLRHQPDQQLAILKRLQQQPLLQYTFLRAAMQQAMLLQQAQQAAAAAEGATTAKPGSRSPQPAAALVGSTTSATAPAAAGADALLDFAEVADLYIKLLVQFDPAAVMPFLQLHHNYNVAAAIKACAAGGVCDAEAFLHERLGDVDAALRLHVAAIQQSNSNLIRALQAGHIPLLQLPEMLLCTNSTAYGSKSLEAQQQQQSQRTSRGQAECSAVCSWGLGPLLSELQAAAAAAAAAQDRTGGAADVNTAMMITLAAAVATSLLHHLSPLTTSSSGSTAHHRQQLQHHAWVQPSGAHSTADAPPAAAAASVQGQACQHAAAFSISFDLHKAWMAELSLRLKLKGLGCSTVHVCPYAASQSASSIQSRIHSSIQQQLHSSAGVLQRVTQAQPHVDISTAGFMAAPSGTAAAAPTVLPAVPAELHNCWKALQAAVAFCQRNTTSNSSSRRHSSSAASIGSSKQQQREDTDTTLGGKQLWFGLMDVYVEMLRCVQVPASDAASTAVIGVPQQQQQEQGAEGVSPTHAPLECATSAGDTLLSSLAAAAARQLPAADLPAVLLSGATAASAVVAHDLFSLFLDEVVCVMADNLPLLDIVGRVLQRYGSERFGEFRSTLLGLFGATAYERAIMTAANRLITGDAFGAVRRSYSIRQLARQPAGDDTEEQQQPHHATTAAGPSSLAAAARVDSSATIMAADVLGSVPHRSTAVQTACMLGLLGRTASSSSSGQQLSPSQAEQGTTSAGGLRLQLQPAGPAAGHLHGVAAEYRAAALAVHNSKRVYKGEIDLALEIAALNSNSHIGKHRGQPGAGHNHSISACTRSTAADDHMRHEHMLHSHVDTSVGNPDGRTSFDLDELLNWSQANIS